ncbi:MULTISPECIES: hypothetical protein [Dyella]|uniref:Uncharacterized protein n=2 Tax=Dyella TaxID=231454 RepID=A0A4R0Z2X3_9GAMM|nr:MULTISPECIES: hypothetical protein [Dyella]TBR38853.1 hypothetical protein EYV96_00960 [Dyella terrae]TCI13556.1 hypothetical protein EZM97_09910 [Dyella soli]
MACLFGVLVTLASMTQSISKWPTSGSSLTSVSWVGQDSADKAGDLDGGSFVVDDQCLDDIMVEPFPWEASHVRAPAVAIGHAPVLRESPLGLVSPPPEV